MYRTFSVKNFRGFDDLTVDGLGRINLIAGKNNVGKTALLEALWVHCGGIDPGRALHLDAERGLGLVDPESVISNLFYAFNLDSAIELCAWGDWGNEPRRLEISSEASLWRQQSLDMSFTESFDDDQSYPQIANFPNRIGLDYTDESGVKSTATGWLAKRWNAPGYSIESERGPYLYELTNGVFLRSHRRIGNGLDARRYSRLEVNGQQDGILQVLQEVEPSLQELTVVAAGPGPKIYANVGLGRLIPVQLMGEGMSRILSLALAIASVPGGIVLVDEIENGIHHSVMEEVWKAVGAFARSYDVQLFATTHSYECIGAAYRAFDEDKEDELRLFRIQRNRDGKYQTVKFDRERIGNAFEFRLGFI